MTPQTHTDRGHTIPDSHPYDWDQSDSARPNRARGLAVGRQRQRVNRRRTHGFSVFAVLTWAMLLVLLPVTVASGADEQTTAAPASDSAGAPRWLSLSQPPVLASPDSQPAGGTQAAEVGEAPASDDEALAKKLSNPIASLISVPLQFNFDRGYGPKGEGHREFVNIQPVIPFSLSPDWNLISRTILPIVHQERMAPGLGSQCGLGDVVQSFWFSPAKPGPSGIIWGVGPVLLLPTATDELLGAGKWGAGPTVIALKQSGPWTIGVLANHIWSFAGDDSRAAVNTTFLQPFVSYTTKDAWTFSLNTETTYAWETHDLAVPINLGVSKLLKLGKMPVQIGGGVRYWAASPDQGPEGWGARLSITFLFPK